MTNLAAMAAEAGITGDSLILSQPRNRLIRMYETNRGEGVYAAFEATQETEDWVDLLEAYNEFVAAQDIQPNLSDNYEDTAVTKLNRNVRKDAPHYLRPELFRTYLYRQFNHRSFAKGGRLYGGWWINHPSELRPDITINENPTVEWDFSGCSIRMVYHLDNKECPDDPYFLPQIEEYRVLMGYKEDHFREAIKRLTNALINGEDRDKDIQCSLPLPQKQSFSPRFTRKDVAAMIEAKHHKIAHAFGSGIGMELQRRDSDIALAVITNLMRGGIIALPIHDSFIVEEENEDRLRDEMVCVYRDQIGYDPVIKRNH